VHEILAMLCRRHHRCVHEEGYQIERLADGELQFRRPNGLVLPDVPPPPAVPDDPVEALREMNEADELTLDARTTTPTWQGEHLDVVYAIDVLHPLATGEAETATASASSSRRCRPASSP
jgi:hypothetical protein